MKKWLISFLTLTISILAFTHVSAENLDSDAERIGYALGVLGGSQLKAMDADFNIRSYTEGLVDAYYGTDIKMTDEEIEQTLTAFQERMIEQQQTRQAELLAENLAEGEAFLANNSQKPGVITLDSGLQYKIIEAGSGASPTIDDSVQVIYSGRLIDGTEFDGSDEPLTLPLTGVIPGWTEALQLMSVGSTWELYIPAELAYADFGAGPVIEPGATLIFTVTLVDIEE